MDWQRHARSAPTRLSVHCRATQHYDYWRPPHLARCTLNPSRCVSRGAGTRSLAGRAVPLFGLSRASVHVCARRTCRVFHWHYCFPVECVLVCDVALWCQVCALSVCVLCCVCVFYPLAGPPVLDYALWIILFMQQNARLTNIHTSHMNAKRRVPTFRSSLTSLGRGFASLVRARGTAGRTGTPVKTLSGVWDRYVNGLFRARRRRRWPAAGEKFWGLFVPFYTIFAPHRQCTQRSERLLDALLTTALREDEPGLCGLCDAAAHAARAAHLPAEHDRRPVVRLHLVPSVLSMKS